MEHMAIINIAIDGPAGAGKSTIAKRISKKRSIVYVDTGAMYRALGLKAVRSGFDPGDAARVVPMLPDTDVTIEYRDGAQHIILDGEDVNGFIRTEEISQAASVISTIPEVRVKLVELQRALAKNQSIVMDGRDIGTYVLPDAPYKFYITASPEVRARRRYLEYEEKGTLDGRSFEQILEEIRERDYRDSNREFAPLRPAEDAVYIDTSEMDIDTAVNIVLERLKV